MTAEQENWIAHRVLREVRDGIDHPAYLVDWALWVTGDLVCHAPPAYHRKISAGMGCTTQLARNAAHALSYRQGQTSGFRKRCWPR